MNRVSSFDPDRFVAPAPATVQPLFDIPNAWSHGLILLADRVTPRGLAAERWRRIVSDAKKIATIWQHRVLPGGWSIENLFGFDPRLSDGAVGLAVALDGGELLSVEPHEAVIIYPGWTAIHRPRVPAGSALLWNFNERDLSNAP